MIQDAQILDAFIDGAFVTFAFQFDPQSQLVCESALRIASS